MPISNESGDNFVKSPGTCHYYFSVWSEKKNDNSVSTLEKVLKNFCDTKVYVLWNDAALPAIATNLQLIINHFFLSFSLL